MSEADTCRQYITPALQKAGWDSVPHYIRHEEYFTDGRLMPVGDGYGQAERIVVLSRITNENLHLEKRGNNATN